jgi:hypothetical protein
VNFTMLPAPPKGVQAAVWRDLNQLGKAPSTAPIPYAPGNPGTPPIGVIGG